MRQVLSLEPFRIMTLIIQASMRPWRAMFGVSGPLVQDDSAYLFFKALKPFRV